MLLEELYISNCVYLIERSRFMYFTIAIVGRSNVGKTTIFNRLVNKKTSIVADCFGVTRDRNEVLCDYYDLKVKLIDSAGIEYQKKDILNKQMFNQAIKSIDLSDLCLFVIDGKDGITNADLRVFDILRKKNKLTILVINKTENIRFIDMSELSQFNTVCDKILLSAEHNHGFNDLYNAIKIQYNVWKDAKDDENFALNKQNNQNYDCENSSKIRVAVIGRPNAGKSTLLNNLLNEDRLITSDIAGTTRDKIELNFTYRNHEFVLIDTAGVRKKHKNGDFIEVASVEKSFEAIQFADVVIAVMDITVALEEQDLSICQKVCNEGRILIVCFNKWDLVSNDKEKQLLENLKNVIRKSLAQVKGIRFFTCSAINDKNLTLMLDEVVKLYCKWDNKISSGKINKKIIESKMTINVINELKIKYINQIKVRPPAFVAFSGKNEKDITAPKVESLKNWLYRELDLSGIPIRLSVRGKKKKQ